MSMIPDEEPVRATIGHNQPPSPIEALVAAQRDAQTDALRERRDYIIGRAEAKKIDDRETAGQAGDIIKVAGVFIDKLEADALELRRPYRDAADAAKAESDRFLDPLRDVIEALRARLEAWAVDEDKRIADQQAEQEAFFRRGSIDPDKEEEVARQQEETGIQPRGHAASIAADNLKAPRRRRIVGDLGAVVSAVDTKVYTVEDVREVPDFILNSKTVHDAIIQVAKSMGKHVTEIPGISIGTTVKNQIR